MFVFVVCRVNCNRFKMQDYYNYILYGFITFVVAALVVVCICLWRMNVFSCWRMIYPEEAYPGQHGDDEDEVDETAL